MPWSPGRYPGVSCRSRSAARRPSPSPGLTRKNRLNSLVEPTEKPGRTVPVSDADIPTSRDPAFQDDTRVAPHAPGRAQSQSNVRVGPILLHLGQMQTGFLFSFHGVCGPAPARRARKPPMRPSSDLEFVLMDEPSITSRCRTRTVRQAKLDRAAECGGASRRFVGFSLVV